MKYTLHWQWPSTHLIRKCTRFVSISSRQIFSSQRALQTLASVRLSQERPDDAKTAALKSWSCWKTLAPGSSPPLPLSPRTDSSSPAESPQYPASTTRLSLARLFLEVSLYASALEILQRLENEDDEDGDIWYLSGWAWWLLGEERAGAPEVPDVETKDECWSEGKLCLENYLRVSPTSIPSLSSEY